MSDLIITEFSICRRVQFANFIELLLNNNVRCKENSGQLYINFVGGTLISSILFGYCT